MAGGEDEGRAEARPPQQPGHRAERAGHDAPRGGDATIARAAGADAARAGPGAAEPGASEAATDPNEARPRGDGSRDLRGPELVPEAAKDGVVANPNHRELEAPDLGSDAEQTKKKKARSAMDVDTPREYSDKIPRTLSQASNTRDANVNEAMKASDADEEEEEEEEDDDDEEEDEVEDDEELQDDIDDAEQMQDLLKNGIAIASRTRAMAGRSAGVSRARRQDQTAMDTGANVRPLSGSDFEDQHANADGSGGGTDVEDNLSVAGVDSVGTPAQQDASPASLQDFTGNFFNENPAGSGMISRSSSVGSTHPSTDGKFVDPIIQALKESPISQNAFDGLRERMRFLLRFHLRLAKSKDTAQEQARARDAGESKTEGQAQRSDADGADEDKGNEGEDASILDEGEDARREAISTAYLVRASVDTLLARCEALMDADVQNILSFFTFTLETYAQMFTAPLGEVHVAVLKLLSSGPRSPFFQLCGPVTLRRGHKLGSATVPYSAKSDAVASPPRASFGFLQLVEVFCDLGCLEAMVKELTHESPSPLFARHCVQVFSHIVDFLRPHLAGLLVKALVGALSVYLSGLSNTDLHRLDRSVLYEIFMQTHFLLNRTSIMSAQEARRCVEGLRLSVALKQLRSPFMQQRLAGLRQIRTIVEDAEFRASESARVQAAQTVENKDPGARPLVSRKRSPEEIGSSVLRKRPNVGQLQISTDELMDSALQVAAAEAPLHVGTRNNVGNLPSGTSEDETFFKSAIKSIFRSETPHPQDEHDTADLAAGKSQQSPVPSADSVADALAGLADCSRKSQKETTTAKEADADAALAEALASESSADRETLAIAARAFADSDTPFETLDRLCSKTQRILERVADKLKSRSDNAALDRISLSAATPVDMAATRQEPETSWDVAAAAKDEVVPNSARSPCGHGALTDVMTVNKEGQLSTTKLGPGQESASGNEKVQSAEEVTKSSDSEELPDSLPTSTSEKTATTTSPQLPPASDLATEALAIWFKENRVVQVIFGPDYIHTEVLKRCSEICRFLATQDLFSEEDLDLVWDTAFGTNAHESIRDTLCSILAELARYLWLDKLNYVWDKIKSIDLAAHDTKTLSLVRNFTVNAVISLRIHGDVNLTEAASAQNWYGLGLLWDMVQDETTCAAACHKAALQHLTHLCAWQPCFAARTTFLRACMTNLRDSKSVPQSLKLMRAIITSFPLDSSTPVPASSEQADTPRQLPLMAAEPKTPTSRRELAACQSWLVESCLANLKQYKIDCLKILATKPELHTSLLSKSVLSGPISPASACQGEAEPSSASSTAATTSSVTAVSSALGSEITPAQAPESAPAPAESAAITTKTLPVVTAVAVGRQGHTNAEDFRDEDMHEDKYECDIYDEEAEDFGHHDEMDVSNADAASRAVLKTNQGGSSASSSSTLGHVDKDISAATTLPNTILPSDLEASGDASLPNHSRRSSLSSNAQGGGAFGASFGKATEKGTENPLDSYKLIGKYSHLRGLRIRLNFLRFVVMSCGKESEDFQLTATQAEVILEHLGCKALTLNERSLALSWIMQMHFVANAFGPNTARTALLNTFRQFSLESLRNRDFSFFEYFFRVVNADIGRLEYKPGSKPRPFNFTQATPRAFSGDASWLYNKSAKELRRCLSGPESMSGTPNSFKVVDAHLYGLGMLWCMALRADSGTVARRASKMLCTLFSSMAPGSDAERTLQEIKDPDERALVAQAWGDDATVTTSKAVSLSSSSENDGACGLLVGGFLREALAQLKQALVSRYPTASRRRVRCLVLLKDLQAACACPSLVERSHGARVERVNRAEGILDGETVELRIKEVSKSNAELSIQLAKVAPVAELRNSVAALLQKDPELLRFISSGREIKAPDKAEKGTISFQSGQVIYVVVRQAVSANPDDANAAATAKSDSLPSASKPATNVREAPKTVPPVAQHEALENGDSVLIQGNCDEGNMAKDIGGLQRSRGASVETMPTSATNPEAILQQPEHVQLLTELLFAGSLSDGVAAQTWDLLQDLPTRHDLLQSIRENSVSWDELCDLRPIHKTLYALQSMHFMLCCEDSGFSAISSDAVEPGMSVAWAQKAIINGAASKLIQVLVSLNSEATSVLRTHPLGMYCVLEFLCVISRLLRAMSKAELLALLEVQGPALNEALLTAVRTVASTAPPDTATPSETSAPGAIGPAGRESKSMQERNKAVAHDVVMRALSLRLWICEASDLAYFGCSVNIVAQGTGAKAFSQDWLISCLLRCPDGSVKKDVATSLRGYPCQSQGLLQALASVLDATEQPECHNRSNEYFSLLCDVAKNALRAQDDRVNRGEGASENTATPAEWAEELGGRLFSALRSHVSTEKRAGANTFPDQTLYGLLDALEVLVSGAHLKTTLRKPESLVSFVFHECLFEIEMGNADGKPMCKSAASRAAAFRLLLAAASSSASSLQELLRLIESQHKQTDLCPLTTHGLIEHANFPSSMRWLIEEESDDRQIRDRENQWQYEPASQRKAESGYVGLRNLGCICYMNSLLQQLYMIPEFRLAILRSGDTAKKRTRRARESESVLMQQEEEERRGSVSESRDDNPDPDQGPKQQRVDAAGKKSGARDDVQEPKYPPLERSLSGEELIKHRQYKLLLRQTRRMFSWLQESQKRAYDMTCFCNESVSLNQGNPVDIFEQQDVDEFFNVLMDQLECGLKDTKRPNVLRELFGGVLCNQILCKEGCSHRSEREENFMVCQLEVKGKQSILESLDLYVEGEMLEGDNKYLCGECNEKRDAQKRAFFASLPNVFMIHLKRFDFDLELLRKIKVNDHCEFPLELNMKKYTREALEGRLEDSKPDSYYEYELVGILVHTGTADSGHYYSFIKERVPTADRTSCEWFHFNDEQVSHFDPATIPETSFGGAKNAQWDPNQQRAPSQSWSNKPYSAYMLIYERRGRPCLPGLEPGQARAEEVLPVLRKAVPSSLRRTCWQENLDYMSDEMVLDPAYGRFVVEACRLVTDGTGVSERNKLAALQACAAYCINTLVHAREKEHLDTLLDQLKRLVELGGPAATKAMLENFEANGATAIKQLLLRCPLPQVREKFRSFVVQMLQENVEKEREGYEKSDVSIVGCWSAPHMEYDVELWRWRSMGELVQNDSLCLVQPLTLDRVGTLCSLGGPSLDELGEALWQHCLGIPCVPPVEAPSVRLIGWMLAHSTDAHQWWRAIDSFFAVLSAFADMGDLERTYMVRMGAIPRLLDFLLEHNSPSLRVLNRNPERDLESRRGMGDKFDSPTLLQAVRTLSTLVRACELPDGALDADDVDGVGGDGDSGAFVQREGVAGRVLTWLDVGLIFRTPFLVRLVDHHNSFWITDLQDILQHLGTGSTLLTSHIASAVRNMLFVAPAAAVEALLRTCEHLFNSDETRTISVAKNHALVLMESLLSPNLDCEAVGLGVMHMSRLLSGTSRFAVAQALFQHAPEWMLALLVDNESEVVRRETASMVLLMVAAFEERRELRASASEILREKDTVSSASTSSSAPAKTIATATATATAGLQAEGVSMTSASAVSLSSTPKDKNDGNAATSMDAASDGGGEEHETLGTLQLLLTLLSPSFMQTSCSKSAYEFIALRRRALPSIPLKPAIRRWEGPKKEPVDFHDTQGEEIAAHPGESRSRAIARWAERLKETAKEPGPFTLVSALRTLLVLLKLCRGEPMKRFVGAAEIDVIVMAILAADAYKYECDWNKGELIAFLYEVTRGREDLLAQCAADPETWSRLLNISMAVRPTEGHYLFNETYAPVYYRLFCAWIRNPRTRAGALQMLDSLHHLKWAVRYYLLDVTEYVRTVAPLRLLVRASVPLLRDNSFAALTDLLQSALIGSVQEPMHRVGLDNVLLILRGLSGAVGLRAPGEPEDDAIASIYASRAHAAEAHATAIAKDLLVRGKATTVMLSTVLTHLRNISEEQYASTDEKRAHMQYGLLVLCAVWARLCDARDLLAEQLITSLGILNDRRVASSAANSAATNSTRMEDEDSPTAANAPAGATTGDATEAQLAEKMQGVEELEAASVSSWIQFILLSGEFHADEHVDLLEATSKCVLATVALAKKHARTLTNMAELGRAIGSCITRLMKRLQHGEVESKRLPAVYLDAITHSCEALLRAHYLDTEGSRNLPPLLMSVVSVLLLVAIEHRHSPSKHAEVATILERVAKRAPTDAWIRHNEQAELYINLLSSEPEAMQSLESYDESSRSILSRFRASLTSEDADGN